ncbi:hypothetical protein BMS3Abin04_01399 [bacterium BMS3Abin04]|nr:hypothetical protein BMS3Abin04_01399 [bacterium BMS3Abin04]
MTKAMRNKLAEILDRVKEPENGIPLSRMELVAGIKYNYKTNEFSVYMYTLETVKACCMVFQLNEYAAIETLLKTEIEKEFPGNKVVFKNP